MSLANGRERGEYLTGNRAEALGREISALEARMQARVDQLAEELSELRARQNDELRAQVKALLNVLQERGG